MNIKETNERTRRQFGRRARTSEKITGGCCRSGDRERMAVDATSGMDAKRRRRLRRRHRISKNRLRRFVLEHTHAHRCYNTHTHTTMHTYAACDDTHTHTQEKRRRVVVLER